MSPATATMAPGEPWAASLGRYAKGLEECMVVVSGTTVRLYEGAYRNLRKATAHATPESAAAAGEAIVARRLKAGYRLNSRVDGGPWLPWIDALETMWQRVIDDASVAGVACKLGPGHMTHFQRAFPRTNAALAERVGPELAALLFVSPRVRLQWLLGDDPLRIRIAFEIGVSEWADGTHLWTREQNGACVARGVVAGGIVRTFPDDEGIEPMDLAAFRAWFPRHVRDTVVGFAIAEIARH